MEQQIKCSKCSGSGKIKEDILEGDIPSGNWGTGGYYKDMPCGEKDIECDECGGTGKVSE